MAEELFEQHFQEDGYTIGMDPCLDRCWENFRECIKNSTNSLECIAQLEACKRSCGQRTNEEGAEQ